MLTSKPTEKRPPGSPMSRWEDSIIVDLKEIDVNTWSWNDSVQEMDYWRILVNAALNLRGSISYRVS